MLIIGSKEQVQEYRDNPAINQSTLKNVQYGLASFLKKQNEKGPVESFAKGSAVDCILTAPKGAFEEEFYISTLDKKPSETEMAIVQYVFDRVSNLDGFEVFEVYTNIIEEAITELNWQANWKMETRIKKIAESPVCKEYFNDLVESKGKTVLSMTQYTEVMAVVESLRTNEATKRFFDREYIEKSEQLVCLYQIPIYFKIKGHECKALPDIVLLTIDDNKKIKEVLIIDLKTMWGNTLDFFDKVVTYRYDIQAAFYQEAIFRTGKSLFSNLGYTIGDETEVLPFFFVVESMSEPGKPLIYQVDKSLMNQGMNGTPDVYFEDRLIKKGKRGVLSLLEEYVYYQNNEFTEDLLLKDSNGHLTIDINGITM